MADDTMNLQAVPGKSTSADFLREMIGFAAQRLMELEVGGLTGAGYGEKSPERLAPARRLRRVRLGDPGRHRRSVNPQAAQGCPEPAEGGSYFLGFLERRRLADKALTAVIQEAYIQPLRYTPVAQLGVSPVPLG